MRPWKALKVLCEKKYKKAVLITERVIKKKNLTKLHLETLHQFLNRVLKDLCLITKMANSTVRVGLFLGQENN